MMKVDSHQHFWLYSIEEYDWIGENEQVIRKDFLPTDLAPTLAQAGLDKCVAVQARQTDQETKWLLELAENNDIVGGVVGWIDLKADNLAEQIASYGGNTYLKGFRHVLQGEPDPRFMLAPDFVRGLKVLEQQDLSYDLLIFAKQLPESIQLIEQFDSLRVVVDHIAKPDIVNHSDFTQWELNMEKLAKFPNVFCKVSGMVTEADVNNWQASDFTRYLDVIFNAFGAERIMFGSDWPVCLLGGDYQSIKAIVEDFVTANYPASYDQVFGETATRFYRLS